MKDAGKEGKGRDHREEGLKGGKVWIFLLKRRVKRGDLRKFWKVRKSKKKLMEGRTYRPGRKVGFQLNFQHNIFKHQHIYITDILIKSFKLRNKNFLFSMF